MELCLQFGWGMMEHCHSLISAWGGGTVILSPRDLSDTQLRKLAAKITRLPGSHVLLDPQFYLPHADHERLRSHEFWPVDYSTGAFWQGAPLKKLMDALRDLNTSLGTNAFIVPGVLTDNIDDDWISIQESIIGEAVDQVRDRPLIATIALGADAVRHSDQIEKLIERSEEWDVPNYYLVAQHPNGSYLVTDPIWLANILDIVAALRLRGAKVIVGYSNHQMLIAGSAKATAISSGTWMNVRSFPPDKFRAAYEDEVRQRTTWYYCPQALSEYKLPFLDIAQRQGLLSEMAPGAAFNTDLSKTLFGDAQPSVSDFSEQAAFRHYLECLRTQTLQAVAASFDETIKRHQQWLDGAEALIDSLSASGIRGQMRDFADSIDVNRAALLDLASTRGPVLRRRWATL